MKAAIKYSLATTVVALLSACGGGGDDGGYQFIDLPSYGSIAINQNNGRAGITANYSSQNSANDAALEQCGSSCVTVLEVEPNLCGALARSSLTPTFGWASDRRLSDAKARALTNCTNNNGVSCEIVLDACNE
jgi:hypothetical protein